LAAFLGALKGYLPKKERETALFSGTYRERKPEEKRKGEAWERAMEVEQKRPIGQGPRGEGRTVSLFHRAIPSMQL